MSNKNQISQQEKNMKLNIIKTLILAALGYALIAQGTAAELLNVSYDPTRELYTEYNELFKQHWKQKTGQDISINQSHGGSGKQARSVIDGLEADVVTLALGGDIDEISKKAGLLPSGWQKELPDNSSPYTSTIVFVVRKGNPKGIKDWNDLAKPGISVITPNPKTSGGARWNFLAAWAWAKKKYNGDEGKIKEYISQLYKNVPVLDSGARGSTTTFAERGIGDVFISWENEAYLLKKELGPERFDIIYPSISVLAEPPVAVVSKNAVKNGNGAVAKEYLQYLYSPQAQDIIAKHYYRPRDAAAAQKYSKQFPNITLVTIDGDFGGWEKAHEIFFKDNGVFDQIYDK